MVDPVGSGAGYTPFARTENPLTADQQKLVKDTLSKFDPKTLTKENARAIIETFEKAGLEPTEQLFKAVKDAEFDPEAIGEVADFEEPDVGQELQSLVTDLSAEGAAAAETLKAVQSILQNFDLNNLSEEDEESIFQQFEEQGLFQEDSQISILA